MGSCKLFQLLIKNDLADELRLKIHPLTLSKRENLFENGTIPAAFILTECIVTTTGVIIANTNEPGKSGRELLDLKEELIRRN